MISYRKMETRDEMKVHEMIKELYREDPGMKPITDEHIGLTFGEFAQFPEKGSIFVFDDERTIFGYAILVNMWSNEYGGNVLEIDELFVVENRRGEGVGSAFIKWLIENRLSNCVTIELGTTPQNIRARKLYESMGFKLSESHRFAYEF